MSIRNGWSRPTASIAVVLAAILTACASERQVRERGWIGGRFAEVAASSHYPRPVIAPDFDGRRIVGMPEGIDQEHGLLLVLASEETPLARAGLQPSDLL